MQTSDYQYYEGLIWRTLRERGRSIKLDGDDPNVWAFNTVIMSGANALHGGHSEFSVVMGNAEDWHKNLLGA